LPGEAEEWQLTIKGAKKDAVAAELLAGLYDASLDALKPHRWNWNRLSPTQWLGLQWTTNQTFGTNVGNLWLNNVNGKQPEGYEKRYDELQNYLALGGGRSRNFMIRGVPVASVAREEAVFESVERAPDQGFALNETV